MTVSRVTKGHVEVASDGTPAASVTKDFIEVASDGTPNARVTKSFIEVASSFPIELRVEQAYAELLVQGPSALQVEQVYVELLVPNQYLFEPVTSGQAVTDGTGPVSKTKNPTPTGTIDVGGAATLVQIHLIFPTGGVLISGAASTTRSRIYVGVGGAVTNGSAEVTRTWAFSGSGEAVLSGAAATEFLDVTTFVLLRPIQDISAGGWHPEPYPSAGLYDGIDEATTSTSDYIWADVGSTEFEFKVESTTDPVTDIGHGWRIVAAGAGKTLTTKFVNGTTIIATRNVLLDASDRAYDFSLTQGEAANISDYSDIRIRGSIA